MRKRKKYSYNKKDKFSISSEAKKGIIIVVLIAFIVLSFLSLFHLAGRFGLWLEEVLKQFFGIGYIIFPFLLSAVTYFIVSARKKVLTSLHYVGLVFFVLSFYGIFHLTQDLNQSFTGSLKQVSFGEGGGYIGLILGYPAGYFLGFWGSLVIFVSAFIGSILLIFNVSLDNLLSGLNILKIIFSKGLKVAIQSKDKFHNYRQQKKFGKEHENEEEEEFIEEDDNDKEVDFVKTEISGNEEDLEGEQEEIKFNHKPKKKKIDLPLDLLHNGGDKPTSGDINANMETIRKTLENFNIEVEMGKVSVGPTVTQHTLRPAEGVKLSQIITLSNDLALALAAHPIRIEAPIPGKSLVGVEVPNKQAAKVRLKDIITSDEFKNRPSDLMITLGKDVSGKTWMTDLTRNPHLLIAGSTGSGKTICINTIILSLMYQNSPDDLKFIMIDPKRVELPIYGKTPYLLTPVITKVKETVNALKWAVSEMERRFEVLSDAKNRDIFSYRAAGNTMPSVIIIIDELADLMASAGPEIEALIIRLAQMSRAVGIYLILATQRPSVNVITGLIKANITSRIAFSVASLVDSRTILDSSGAEKLLGRGDMLFVSAETSKPKRLQGAFVSESEIKKITSYIKLNYDSVEYDETVVERQGGVSISGKNDDFGEDEELIEMAKEIVVRGRKASASLLQRRMRIGYNKAARLIEALEELGIIGPADGAKSREVLVSQESLDEEKENNNEEEN
ncbi:hypothetical protein HOD96_00040 [Candidatus Falkowbacteria bacterium]|nr:hypothetical protein [Candidatus Falkowbacteria bacterium]MBT4432799.1 hypothetical protein [Candidatus Falkowbacteria bacterium]